MTLCYVDDSSDKSDIVLTNQIADTIMLFLPGIASGLQEVAIESDIQGHKITMVLRFIYVFYYTLLIYKHRIKIKNALK